MKKFATAAALIVALAIPGLALANAPKAGDKLNLCEKQGVYTLLGAKDKCDGQTVQGVVKSVKDGKVEVDVKGKKVMVAEPKTTAAKVAPAPKKVEPVKAPEKKSEPAPAPTAPPAEKK